MTMTVTINMTMTVTLSMTMTVAVAVAVTVNLPGTVKNWAAPSTPSHYFRLLALDSQQQYLQD